LRDYIPSSDGRQWGDNMADVAVICIKISYRTQRKITNTTQNSPSLDLKWKYNPAECKAGLSELNLWHEQLNAWRKIYHCLVMKTPYVTPRTDAPQHILFVHISIFFLFQMLSNSNFSRNAQQNNY
jgi:hypothetical protein